MVFTEEALVIEWDRVIFTDVFTLQISKYKIQNFKIHPIKNTCTKERAQKC